MLVGIGRLQKHETDMETSQCVQLQVQRHHRLCNKAASVCVYLSWTWHWESVKLEGVCTVSMRGLLFQILWQIDDHDSVERAFLGEQR